MKTLTATTIIGGIIAAGFIGLAGPASAATQGQHCAVQNQRTQDSNTGVRLICKSTGATGKKWVRNATR